MLWHRVADAKGMTVDEFLSRHTGPELTEYVARDALEPYDLGMRIETSLAQMCSLIYNAHYTQKFGKWKPTGDFLPRWGEELRGAKARPEIRPQTVKEVREVMSSLKLLLKRKAGKRV